MTILTSEMKSYKSIVVDDTGSNGGRMSSNEIVDAVKNNIWPDIPQSERTAGSTKYRKVFLKIANVDDLTLVSPQVFVETFTPGDDSVSIFPATVDDIQSDLTGSERLYGGGQLATTTAAVDTTITVDTEGVAFDHFQDGDTIRVSDKPDVNGAGNEVFAVITGAPVYTVDQCVITLTAAIGVIFTDVDTRVCSVIEPADIIGSFDNKAVVSVSGTYDEATYPPAVDSIGGVVEEWTFTFTGATTFDVVGDTVGSVGSGNVTTNFAPTNSDFGRPYFTLDYNGWGGTWAVGETLIFRTLPAAYPVWEKRIVPAGAASLSGNKVIVGIIGESA